MRPLTPWMACSRAMQEQLPRVLSFPFPLRFLFASRPEIMGRVLSIVYRAIAMHLIKKAGFRKKTAQTGAVTLIQRFGGALNLNIHLQCMDARMPRAQGCARAAHMLFLDGVYVDHPNGITRFRWVKAPTSQEVTQLAHTIAQRVGRFLERQGLLEQDAENSYLASDAVDEDPMAQLLGHSMMCMDARMTRSTGMCESGHLPYCHWPASGTQGVQFANPAGLRSGGSLR